MRLVIQRVKYARVSINGIVNGEIEKGFMVLFGASEGDSEKEAAYLAKKLSSLRVFEDEEGKMNLALKDVGGRILSISQFTLYADCKKGNRPSFVKAMRPENAEKLYNFFNEELERNGVGKVEKGIFGADMKVELLNDGPVTIIMDSDEMMKA